MIEDHPNPNKRWQNRRRMAWACLWAGLLFPLVGAMPWFSGFAEIAMPFYIFCGGIIGVYTGSAAYESAKISMDAK